MRSTDTMTGQTIVIYSARYFVDAADGRTGADRLDAAHWAALKRTN